MVDTSNDIDQGKIIDNLNEYLEWNNLPLRLNKRGVCRGLSSLHIKCLMQGKEDNFFKLLTKVANLDPDLELDSELNHFVTEIVLSTGDFDKRSNQAKALEALQIDGQPLKSSFNLSMETNHENWCHILKELDLQENEAMIVGSYNHAISVSKKSNGQYALYDPNYPSGVKVFSNESQLILELHHNVFKYKDSEPLGMTVEVIRPPDKQNTPRSFPSISSLYKKYLNFPVTVDPTSITSSNIFDPLYYAIQFNDNVAVNTLFELGINDKDPVQSVRTAISYNSIDVFSDLFARIPKNDPETLSIFLDAALSYGRSEILKIFGCSSFKTTKYFCKS